MKIKSFVISALLSTGAMAQNTSTTRFYENHVSSQGIRLSFVKPTLESSTKAYLDGNYFGSSTTDMDAAQGVAIGYVNLPIQQVGYTSNLAVMEVKRGSSATLVRLDGNIGYALNNFINLKGGLNLMKFTSGGDLKDLNAGLGYQASLGFQLNRNIGLDIGMTEMNVAGKLPVTYEGVEFFETREADVDYKLKGIEVGLNATF